MMQLPCYQAAIGLLLLFWISESARREAEEGWLWHWVPQEAIHPSAKRLLFAQRNPSSALKEMLEVAARRFNLRHVFGRAGAQQWIDTVFLQFGFTRRGFERRLPEWLAGQTPTVALQELLDRNTGSSGFQRLWDALRDYRQKNVTREHALKRLQDSSWVLPEWWAHLLALATEPVASANATTIYASQSAEPEPGDSFLTAPLLRWNPPTKPYFVCRLAYLNSLALSDDVYDVAVNGQVQTQLVRRSDGSYAPTDGDELHLPFEAAYTTVQLMDDKGQIAAAEEVDLWPTGEDVIVFQLSSGRFLSDAYKQPMATSASYAILIAPDLQIEPQPAYHYSVTGAKLFYLPGGWSAELRVWLEDGVIWEPFFQQRGIPITPAWSRGARLDVDANSSNKPLRWGDKIQLKVTHPVDVEVRFVRHHGGPLEFERQNERCTRVGPLTLTPEGGAGDLQLQVGLRHKNQTHRAKLDASANIVGVAKRKNGSWKPLPERFVLKSETARSAQFNIAPPQRWDGEERKVGDWALMEGDLWLKNLSRNHTPIGEITGLGAPMTLRLGPYNADREAMTVAEAVIDRGVIEMLWETEGIIQVRLSQPVEPGDRHSVVYWDINGQVHQLLPQIQENNQHDLWKCVRPEGMPDYVAVALMYEGWRLGAWWQKDWYAYVEALAKAAPQSTAILLRWFRLPLLAEKAFASVRETACHYPVEFLRAWLQAGDAPPFMLSALTEGWLSAIRTIFLDWMPDAHAAECLINALSEQTELEQAAWRLIEIDPRLLYKVLTVWLPGQPDRQIAIAWVRSLRLKIAEAKDEAAYARLRQQLLIECAHEWKVDPNYIDNGHNLGIVNRAVASARGEHLPRRDEMNIALAISSESLRRLLAMSLLKLIA